MHGASLTRSRALSLSSHFPFVSVLLRENTLTALHTQWKQSSERCRWQNNTKHDVSNGKIKINFFLHYFRCLIVQLQTVYKVKWFWLIKNAGFYCHFDSQKTENFHSILCENVQFLVRYCESVTHNVFFLTLLFVVAVASKQQFVWRIHRLIGIVSRFWIVCIKCWIKVNLDCGCWRFHLVRGNMPHILHLHFIILHSIQVNMKRQCLAAFVHSPNLYRMWHFRWMWTFDSHSANGIGMWRIWIQPKWQEHSITCSTLIWCTLRLGAALKDCSRMHQACWNQAGSWLLMDRTHRMDPL